MSTLIRNLAFVDTCFLLFVFNCLVGCSSMIVWTPAVLGVLFICMCFVFVYLHLFSAIEHVSHRKAL